MRHRTPSLSVELSQRKVRTEKHGWVGRISTYGVVPARTENLSISRSFKNSCCVQECVKTTEDKTQNVF